MIAKQNENYLEPWICDSFGAALIKRTVFDKIRLLDTEMAYCEDADWFLRARNQDISKNAAQDIVLFYRLHEANMTRHREKANFFF